MQAERGAHILALTAVMRARDPNAKMTDAILSRLIAKYGIDQEDRFVMDFLI